MLGLRKSYRVGAAAAIPSHPLHHWHLTLPLDSSVAWPLRPPHSRSRPHHGPIHPRASILSPQRHRPGVSSSTIHAGSTTRCAARACGAIPHHPRDANPTGSSKSTLTYLFGSIVVFRLSGDDGRFSVGQFVGGATTSIGTGGVVIYEQRKTSEGAANHGHNFYHQHS